MKNLIIVFAFGLTLGAGVVSIKLVTTRHELNHLKIKYQRTVEECAEAWVNQEIKEEDLPKIREKWGIK